MCFLSLDILFAPLVLFTSSSSVLFLPLFFLFVLFSFLFFSLSTAITTLSVDIGPLCLIGLADKQSAPVSHLSLIFHFHMHFIIEYLEIETVCSLYMYYLHRITS